MLVLVGKSCVGKDTIQKILIEEYGMEKVVTCTTRPPRNGEVDGVDYHFIDIVDMMALLLDDYLAESTGHKVANGEEWFYASLKKDYENSDNKVIILNPKGVKVLREKGIEAFVVWIDSPENLIKGRQMARGDDPKEAKRRRNSDLIDFANISPLTDTCVINWGEGAPAMCAETIYQVYEHWKDRRSKNVEN